MLAFVIDRDTDHRVKISVSLAFLGYEVMQFDLAEDAIAAARSLIPSLVLTDVFLPDDDGAEALDIIGRLYPRCQMIAMLRSPEALAAPLLSAPTQLGASATVAKPVDHAELSAAVQRVRRLAGDTPEPTRPFPAATERMVMPAAAKAAVTRQQT